MVRIKNICGTNVNIEDRLNKFLEQCDEKGYVVRNITFIYAERHDGFNVFVEYETMDSKKGN